MARFPLTSVRPPLKKPHNTLKSLGVGRMVVKYHAHGLTLFAVFWSPPSVISALLFFDFLQCDAGVWALGGALVFPAIHVLSIVGAIYYWITEHKRKVTVLKIGGESGAGFVGQRVPLTEAANRPKSAGL